ncbi:MAG: endonuclease/exonuclease/phosphatase family protein [Promethearchaeota archaeon]
MISPKESSFWNIGLIAHLWLGYIFWSLLSELVASVYFLNLAVVSLNESILILLVIFSPILLGLTIIREKVFNNLALVYSSSIIGILAYLLPSSSLRALLIGIGFAGCFIALASEWLFSDERQGRSLWGLLLGLILFLVLRYAFFSRNPLWLAWIFPIAGAVITIGATAVLYKEEQSVVKFEVEQSWEWLLTSIGFGSVLFLTHWLFTGYGVIPRWVGIEPVLGGILVILAFALGIFLSVSPWIKRFLWWGFGFFGSILLSLGTGIFGLLGGLLLGVVLPALWFLVLKDIRKRQPGRTYFVGIAVYLILTLASVFTVVYDYVPGGWLFREAEEVILVIALILLGIWRLFTQKDFIKFPQQEFIIPRREIVVALVAISIVGLSAAFSFRVGQDLLTIGEQPTSLTAMTFNIQQGFDVVGNVNFEEVAKVIHDSGATIIGLQETDTTRVSSANRDVVEWLAERLNMYSYYGPKTKDSTFGNALLSVYPIKSAYSVILPSIGELAVLIVATVDVDGTVINVLVAHFGESEPDRTAQAESTRDIINGLSEPVLLLGDFNSEPSSSQIQTILSTGLNDSYADAHNGTHVPTTWGDSFHAGQTIDFIFYKDLVLQTVEVIEGAMVSDHKAILAVFSS